MALLTSKSAGAADSNPSNCDTLAALPLLRMQGLVATIEALCVMASNHTITLARLTALGRPIGDGMDDATPAGQAAQALALLAEVCARYRNTTGQDGLALAHRTISRIYGAALAGTLIAPLRAHQWDTAIDVLMSDSEEPPTPIITLEERRKA